MELRLIFMAIICLCIAQLAFAVEENYPFNLEAQQRSFVSLTKQIRCTTCQNRTLYDSNSGIAIEMRKQIYAMINSNMSEAKILRYLRDKYGDYILFMPPWKKSTLVLWLAPLLMLGAALFGLWRWRVYNCKWQ